MPCVPQLTLRWYGGFNRSKLEECGGKTSDCWLEGANAKHGMADVCLSSHEQRVPATSKHEGIMFPPVL